MKPGRVQLSRRKGWRMQPDTVKVDRTTAFGNFAAHRLALTGLDAVLEFRRWTEDEASFAWRGLVRKELRGKNLACWCPLDQPCHAEVLLEMANA